MLREPTGDGLALVSTAREEKRESVQRSESLAHPGKLPGLEKSIVLCPHCERPMKPLFFSCVCDYCDGVTTETDFDEGYIVWRNQVGS